MRSSQAIPRLLKEKARETLDRFGALIQACSENNKVYTGGRIKRQFPGCVNAAGKARPK